jgi:hypothetical protein
VATANATKREINIVLLSISVVIPVIGAVGIAASFATPATVPYRDVVLVLGGAMLGFGGIAIEEYFALSVERARARALENQISRIESEEKESLKQMGSMQSTVVDSVQPPFEAAVQLGEDVSMLEITPISREAYDDRMSWQLDLSENAEVLKVKDQADFLIKEWNDGTLQRLVERLGRMNGDRIRAGFILSYVFTQLMFREPNEATMRFQGARNLNFISNPATPGAKEYFVEETRELILECMRSLRLDPEILDATDRFYSRRNSEDRFAFWGKLEDYIKHKDDPKFKVRTEESRSYILGTNSTVPP